MVLKNAICAHVFFCLFFLSITPNPGYVSGECWADQMSELIKNEWPPHQFADNQDCVNMTLGDCHSSDRYCSGIKSIIMVYRIVGKYSLSYL